MWVTSLKLIIKFLHRFLCVVRIFNAHIESCVLRMLNHNVRSTVVPDSNVNVNITFQQATLESTSSLANI